MRRRLGPLLLAALTALLPGLAAAQPGGYAARSVHTRARPDGGTILDAGNVRLFVPAGAAAPGAMVGLGVGGVPLPGSYPGATGIVVTASGGLRGDIAAIIAPTAADRAVVGARTPALADAAGGARSPCMDAGLWLVCPVARPGAYIVDATDAPGSDSGLLREALAHAPVPAAGSGRSIGQIAALVAVAALIGAAAALLLGRDQPRP